MKRMTFGMLALLLVTLPPGAHAAAKEKEVKLDGYLEWRQGDALIVDGQRVIVDGTTEFKGKGEATSIASIPIGYECKAKGIRRPDGAIAARQIEARPNGTALFEAEVAEATNQAESEYRRAGKIFQANSQGGSDDIGRLYEAGPQVKRVRAIMRALVPPHIDPSQVRVYVVENPEWNAFAMGNYSIYVFTGLLEDMDDDEVAIILGHELVHATHEHTRKHFKKDMWIQLAALGITAAAEQIDDETKKAVVQVATGLFATAYSNGYGRDLEDQADRVGLRYAYEAGYDITKGPGLWRRFASKYGDTNKVVNFFFGDHSLAEKRVAHLEDELALNYAGGPKRDASRRAAVEESEDSGGQKVSSGERPSDVRGAFSLGQRDSGAQERAYLREGMSPEEVEDLLGEPDSQVQFGNQTNWHYPGLTVVFENDRLKEVKY